MLDTCADHRDPPGIPRHWSPPIDNLGWMSQHIQRSQWSPRFVGYQTSLTPAYHQSQFNISVHPIPSMFTVVCSILHFFGPHLPTSPFSNMDLPLRAYFFSPLNDRIDQSRCLIWLYFLSSYTLSELRDCNKLLNIYNVDVQSARVTDILTTFRTALHNEGRSSLLLLAESLWVCLLSRCTASCSQNLIT